MFQLLTKDAYFAALDRLEEDAVVLPARQTWHMKSIQDAVALDLVRRWRRDRLEERTRVLEIGGGESRVLPVLAEQGLDCTNLDPLDGRDGGPTGVVDDSGVDLVRGLLGPSCPLPNASFDILFSISVVEHIVTPELPGFFASAVQMLRPNGVAIHLIDMYLSDSVADSLADYNLARIERYRASFTDDFRPVGDVAEASRNSLEFSCSLVTNPDNVMRSWNRLAPELTAVRSRSQGVTWLLMGRKAG